MVPLFSLAGIPPLSGFVAKLAVVGPMIGRQHYVLAAIALTVSLLTVLSMARVWEEAFWKPACHGVTRIGPTTQSLLPFKLPSELIDRG